MKPFLTPEGQQEAETLIANFKAELVKSIEGLAETVLDGLYTNITQYIESDAWANFRKAIVDGICDYDHGGLADQYDFKRMRQALLRDHRDEIIHDLNQDLLKENEELKATIDRLRSVIR